MIEPNMLLAGRYRLIQQIDAGGSAYIYKAFDEKTKQTVAVKVLKPELTDNEEFIQRFKKEVQASLKLRHANIIRAYDAGYDQGTYYIVMDLIEGKTLKHLININGPLPLKYVISVAKKLCLALEYAHVKGFVHRDIKPHNVMIDMTGEPYIADFGIAKNLAQNTITVEDNSVMGSVHYFSPEQARGERADKRSDIYSLGILIYEMLCGKVPFDADSSVAIALKHINDEMPDVTKMVQGVPESVNKIIQKATQKDKHFRYKSAFNMYEDLQRCLSEPDGAYIKYTESKRTQQHMEEMHARRSKKSLKKLVITYGIAAAIVVAIIFAVSGLINMNSSKPQPLPDFVGMTQKNALEAARNFDITPTFTYEYSSEAEKDIVIRQDPVAGAEVEKGDPVTLIVSNGTGADVMPDVLTMDIEQAKKALAEQGITVKQILEQTDGDAPINAVVSQEPKAGESVSQSNGVVLTVKKAPDTLKIILPDVQGAAADDALTQLKAEGLEKFFIYDEQSETEAGTVLTQNPQPGTEQVVSRPVSLAISRFDYAMYSYQGMIDVNVPSDDTSVKIGIQGSINDISVYYIVYDQTLPAGMQSIALDITKAFDSKDNTLNKNLVVFINDTLDTKATAQSVTFNRAEGGN
ncbi:Stk1 family PASTA domain-containing Ser/Thr kinase [Christensenella timonensis]|uniref:Stk1 family PASTA domain-containing Ser/Thr kinase n=1 Tax=Christensenella timonensis TaxID=1816678 RepID=UPI0008318801|nr:Stk1 family PASTA domain-containing Ser/Thr kinase [Christensenella timonensis]